MNFDNGYLKASPNGNVMIDCWNNYHFNDSEPTEIIEVECEFCEKVFEAEREPNNEYLCPCGELVFWEE